MSNNNDVVMTLDFINKKLLYDSFNEKFSHANETKHKKNKI
mgnify:CR=1 FL=1